MIALTIVPLHGMGEAVEYDLSASQVADQRRAARADREGSTIASNDFTEQIEPIPAVSRRLARRMKIACGPKEVGIGPQGVDRD
jgi:hypothetical protein